MHELLTLAFFAALVKIVWIDVLLSGDNALVIAMACRHLPDEKRVWGMTLGAGAAVLMRILFTGMVAAVLSVSYLRLLGGVMLFYVAVNMLLAEDEEDPGVKHATSMWSAVVTVVGADAVMSLDNVIAVAAASNGNLVLLALGLLISIPCVVLGANLISKVLDRFPILVWTGGAVLGWIAAGVMVTDKALVHAVAPNEVYMYSAVGAFMVPLMAWAWHALVKEEAAV